VLRERTELSCLILYNSGLKGGLYHTSLCGNRHLYDTPGHEQNRIKATGGDTVAISVVIYREVTSVLCWDSAAVTGRDRVGVIITGLIPGR
jgi:hypothetical protein